MRSANCRRLGNCAELYCPNVRLVCAPAALNLAAVSTPLKLVWLNTLYASTRNCPLICSVIRKFLNAEVSQLLIPGPRNWSFAAFPQQMKGGFTVSHAA